jgi:predicted Zn-dependent protease
MDPLCIDLLETWLMRLKNQFELGAMPMTALCLNSQDFNAFAAPGGIVGVNRGVYLDLATESEIMAVLAHELAHLAQRHHYRGLKNSQRLSTGTLATLAGVVAAIATRQGQAAQSLIMGGQAANATAALAYSRDYEREADRIGVTALAGAGYPPEAMVSVLHILAEKQTQTTQDLAFLSTHPLGIERQSDLDARVAQMQDPRDGQPVLSPTDFQLFRCIQTEGLEFPTGKQATQSCSEIHALLADYRSERYEQALNQFDQLPDAVRQTFSGLDLEIALTLQTGDFDRSREAIETIALFFPSWVQPTIAAVDLAIAEADAKLPRALREQLVQRPERLDLWRALARFAQAFKQDHLLFEARSWDALLHGKLEAAKMQMVRAQEVWPKTVDSRPLDLLKDAIKQTETL